VALPSSCCGGNVPLYNGRPPNVVQISSYSHSKVDPSDVVRIGCPLTLSRDTRIFQYIREVSQKMRNSYHLFVEALNLLRGGIYVDGRWRPVELVMIDDFADGDFVRKVTRYMVQDMGLNLLMGPFGHLGSYAAEVVNEENALIVLPTTEISSVFETTQDRPSVFGIVSPPSIYIDLLFEVLASSNAELQNVAYVQEADAYGTNKQFCDAIGDHAVTYKMTNLGGIDISPGADSDAAMAAIEELEKLNPDVVMLCVDRVHLCQRLVYAAFLRNWMPKAFAMPQLCIDRLEKMDIPEFGGQAGRRGGTWMLGLTPWLKEKRYQSDLVEDWNSESFVERYVKFFGADSVGVDYQAAAAFAGFEVLVAAIERADSLDPGKVAEQLATMEYSSIFGRIRYNNSGAPTGHPKIVQRQGVDPAKVLQVGPVADAEVEVYLPIPRWHEQVCHYKHPLHDVRGYSATYVKYWPEDDGSSDSVFKQRMRAMLKDVMADGVGDSFRFGKALETIPDQEPGPEALLEFLQIVSDEIVQGLDFEFQARTAEVTREVTRTLWFAPEGSQVCGPCRSTTQVAVYNATTKRRECIECDFQVKQVGFWTAKCEGLCERGQEQKEGVCVDCPAGKYGSTGSSCEYCRPGKFTEAPGQRRCKSCGKGKYMDRKGATACLECRPGDESYAEASISCNMCDPGAFSANNGSSQCSLCAPGSIHTNAGGSQCLGCEAGRHSNWGATECTLCQENTFQNLPNKRDCRKATEGATFHGLGLRKGNNSYRYWTHLEGDRLQWEFCFNVPDGCLENEMCAEGSTGVHCSACLPGYAVHRFPVDKTCFKCPPIWMNALSISLAVLIVSSLSWVFAYMALHSVQHPQDVHVIIFKLTISHGILIGALTMVTMDAAYSQQQEIGAGVTELIRRVCYVGVLFRGDVAVETVFWSMHCFFAKTNDELAEVFRNLRHSQWFLPEYASARQALADHHQSVEEKVVIFWMLWPFITCGLSIFMSLIVLLIYCCMHRDFYKKANKFYKELVKKGPKHVAGKYGEYELSQFIQEFYFKLAGIWWPFQYMSKAHNQGWCFKLRRFSRETMPLLQSAMLLCYGWTTIGVLRPMNCHRYGDHESRMVNASTNKCDRSGRLWYFSLIGVFLYGIFYPIFLRIRMRSPENRFDKDFHENNSLLLCGLTHDYIWWDALIFFKRFNVVLLAHLDVRIDYKIPLQLFAAVVYGAIAANCKEYDHRRDGLVVFIELCFVCTWVLSCISVELAYLTGTAAAWLVALSFVVVLHVALGIYLLVALWVHAQHVFVRSFRNNPGTISKWLMARRRTALKQDPYVYFEHLLGWITLCGNRSDQARAPYVAHGRQEQFPLGRPALSKVPSLPVEEIGDPQMRHATKQQRLSLQRTVADTVESVSVGLSESTTFSISILEFVVRVGFFLGRKFVLEEEGEIDVGTVEDEAEDIERIDLAMEDNVERYQANHKGETRAELKKKVRSSAVSQEDALRRMNSVISGKGGETAFLSNLELLQDELRSIIGMGRSELARLNARETATDRSTDSLGDTLAHVTHGMASMARAAELAIDQATAGRDNWIIDESMDNAIEEGSLSPGRKRQLHDWVRLMFDPLLYQHGLRLEILQLGMMRLQWMGRLEVAHLVDCFEPHWLVHNGYRCAILRCYANWTKDAPSQADIMAPKSEEADPVREAHTDYLTSRNQEEQDEKDGLKSAMAILAWGRIAIKKGNVLTSLKTKMLTDCINNRYQSAISRTGDQIKEAIARERELCEQSVVRRMQLDETAMHLRKELVDNPSAVHFFEQEAKRLRVHETLLNTANAGETQV